MEEMAKLRLKPLVEGKAREETSHEVFFLCDKSSWNMSEISTDDRINFVSVDKYSIEQDKEHEAWVRGGYVAGGAALREIVDGEFGMIRNVYLCVGNMRILSADILRFVDKDKAIVKAKR